jgi:hypothetical protein
MLFFLIAITNAIFCELYRYHGSSHCCHHYQTLDYQHHKVLRRTSFQVGSNPPILINEMSCGAISILDGIIFTHKASSKNMSTLKFSSVTGSDWVLRAKSQQFRGLKMPPHRVCGHI